MAHTQEKTEALTQPRQIQRRGCADRFTDVAKITREAFESWLATHKGTFFARHQDQTVFCTDAARWTQNCTIEVFRTTLAWPKPRSHALPVGTRC